jgi:transcriptional regulator with GAF, ATPase, and Fis domain
VRALIISSGKRLEFGDWLPRTSEDSISEKSNASHATTLEENERQHILSVLQMTDWRVRGEKGAAKILDINPSTMESRMKKLKIQREQ